MIELKELLAKIHPIKTQHDLIRIGGKNDGGYLIPNDLKGLSACFSPGVGGTSSFESDLFNHHQISSHLADGSVQSPPAHAMIKSFTKKNLSSVNDAGNMTLQSWIANNTDQTVIHDLLLQMDIEGAEYEVLQATPTDILKQFRIVVLEFHTCHQWAMRAQHELVSKVLKKLEEIFYVVHSHPNNCCGIANVLGFEIPRVLEVTFLRKDRAELQGYCTAFPHPFDRPNVTGKPDIELPKDCYRSGN